MNKDEPSVLKDQEEETSTRNKVATSFDEAFKQENKPIAQGSSPLIAEELAALSEALKKAEEKAEDLWKRLLRKEADLQNSQRLAELDLKKAKEFAIERFASELLEVADSLERGLSYTESKEITLAHLQEGMVLTQSVLLNTLDKHGVKVISPQVGDAFDPTYHQALTLQETTEMEPNRILQMIQKGYTLHNRLLRPARVLVSKASSPVN